MTQFLKAQQTTNLFTKPARSKLYLSQFQNEQPLKEICPHSPVPDSNSTKRLPLSSQSYQTLHSSTSSEKFARKNKARVREGEQRPSNPKEERKAKEMKENYVYASHGAPSKIQERNNFVGEGDHSIEKWIKQMTQHSPGNVPSGKACLSSRSTQTKRTLDQPKFKNNQIKCSAYLPQQPQKPSQKQEVKIYQTKPMKQSGLSSIYFTVKECPQKEHPQMEYTQKPKEHLKIADEKREAPLKAMETPKFSDYYSIQCKKPMVAANGRSRSLAKNMLLQQDCKSRQVKEKLAMREAEIEKATSSCSLQKVEENEHSKGRKVRKLKKTDVKFKGSELMLFDQNKKVINCQSFKASTKRACLNPLQQPVGRLLDRKKFDQRIKGISSPQIPQKDNVNAPESPTEDGLEFNEEEVENIEGECMDVSERHSRDPFSLKQAFESRCGFRHPMAEIGADGSMRMASEEDNQVKQVPNFQPKYGLKKKKNQSLSRDLTGGPLIFSSLSVPFPSYKPGMDSPGREGSLEVPRQAHFYCGQRQSKLSTYRELITKNLPSASSFNKAKSNLSLNNAPNKRFKVGEMSLERSQQTHSYEESKTTDEVDTLNISSLQLQQRSQLTNGEGKRENSEAAQTFLGSSECLAEVFDFLTLKQIGVLLLGLKSKKFSRIETALQQAVFKSAYQNKGMKWKEKAKEFLIERFQVSRSLSQQKHYFKFLLSTPSQYELEIEKDIERTFPTEKPFSRGQYHYINLLHILKAVSVYAPDVGYVQGFNFIVGNLLKLFGQAEDVFYLFMGLLHNIGLDQLYLNGMPGLKALNFMFEVLVQNYLPELAQKFERDDIQADFVSSQWFITLFSHDLSLDNFLLIFLMMALFGQKFLLQVALSLLQELTPQLLSLSMEEALVFLKDFSPATPFTPDTIISPALEHALPDHLVTRLHALHKKTKGRRVLLVRDQDRGETLVKVLPNLPEEQKEESEVEDDFQYNYGKVNHSYLNNASAMDIYYDDGSVDSFEAYGDQEKLCKTQRNPSTRNDHPAIKSYINHVIDFGPSFNDNSQEPDSVTRANFNPYQCQNKKGMKQLGSGSIQCKEEVVELERPDWAMECLDEMDDLEYSQRESKIQSFTVKQRRGIRNSNFLTQEEPLEENGSEFEREELGLLSPVPLSRPSLDQNSEDILESDCKDTLTGNKIQFKILNLQNLQINSPSLLDRIQNECSHNVSVEEFRSNQKAATQSKVFLFPNQEEGLLKSRHETLSRDLQGQFDLNRQGSHLNSPLQQTVRSTLAEVLQRPQIQENVDPNSKGPKKGANSQYQLFAAKMQEEKKVKEVLRKCGKAKNNWSATQESSSFAMDDLVKKAKSPPKKILRRGWANQELPMSPKACTKQSTKIAGHQGDNFCDEGVDLTSLATPKESLAYIPH